MHATTMHFAFVNAPSVTIRTPLGKLVLQIAVSHHEAMEAELKRAEQKANIRKEVFATPRASGQTLQAFVLWANEEVCRRMKDAGLD